LFAHDGYQVWKRSFRSGQAGPVRKALLSLSQAAEEAAWPATAGVGGRGNGQPGDWLWPWRPGNERQALVGSARRGGCAQSGGAKAVKGQAGE